MRLHRDAIIAASLTIVNSYGLADLSMRRLARHLEVTPGALYWHVESKQHLIEILARHILAPVLEAAPTGAVDYAHLLRSCLLRHRDGAEIVTAGLSMPALHREMLGACRSAAGLGEIAATTFLAFVLGSATMEQARQQLRDIAGEPTACAAGRGDSFSQGIGAVLAGLEHMNLTATASAQEIKEHTMSKIVIMGATGMVGAAVAAEAVSRGHEVVGLSRHTPTEPIEGVEYRTGDIADTAALVESARSADVLVLTVPINRATGQSEAIVEAHRNLLAAAPKTRLLVVGGAGGLSTPEGTLLVESPGFPEEYKTEAQAFVKILGLYRQAPEQVNWTMLAPSPEIAPGPAAASYRLSDDTPAGSFVSTGTFAVALLDEVEKPAHERARFSVADAE